MPKNTTIIFLIKKINKNFHLYQQWDSNPYYPSTKRGSYHLNYIDTGAPAESRTPDPLIKSQMLCHLSYRRIVDCYLCTGAVGETRTPALLIKSQLLFHLSYNRIVDCYLCTDGQSLHPQAYIYEKPYQNLAWLELKSWRIKELDFVEMYWIWTNITKPAF